MPKIKIEHKNKLGRINTLNIEVSDEITIKEILEVLKDDYGLKIDLDNSSLFLSLQNRYLDIDSKIDEEGIADQEVLIIGDIDEKKL